MLKDKVLNFILVNKLIKHGDNVLLAVSGGVDSVALLYIFYELASELEINLYVGHFDHEFRGRESKDDAVFVKKLCKKLSIPCTVGKKNIPRILKKTKSVSKQAISRELRYEFLINTANKYNCNILCTAHNLEDQTETFFLHLLRGTGLKGLTGIELNIQIREGISLIRPFLSVSRKEIEIYVKENNISFRQDSSNFTSYYLRNELRHNLLPILRKNYNPNIDMSIYKLCRILSCENDYLDRIVQKKLDKILEKRNNEFIVNTAFLKKLHPCLIRRIIRKILLKLKGNLNAITYKNIKDIENLIYNYTGKKMESMGEFIVRNEYGKLIFGKRKENFSAYEYIIPVPSVTFLPLLGITLKISLVKNIKKKLYYNNNKSAFFSFQELPESFILRNRKNGDRFIPLGMKGSKKLKDFFIDIKIPVEERDRVPLLLYNNEIIWITGYRQSEKYKVKDKNGFRVEVELKKMVKK
ncbi:MAG: tRNA lysidine(34) synthetase TilS [Candidatus Firestonebacteria bacterium]|nr:tRNA lysidine(34) synthetase TilS [Candidatus Firestonebacteria bacterium]